MSNPTLQDAGGPTPPDGMQNIESPRMLHVAHWSIAAVVYVALYLALDTYCNVLNAGNVVQAWYPPAALSLAYVMLFGPRWAPLLMIPSFISWRWMFPLDLHLPDVLGQCTVMAAGYGGAVWFLLRVAKIDRALQATRDVSLLIIVSTLASLGIAILSAYALLVDGAIRLDQLRSSILNWWVGNSIGIVVLTPPILIFGSTVRERMKLDDQVGLLPLLGRAFAECLAECLARARRQCSFVEQLLQLATLVGMIVVSVGGLWHEVVNLSHLFPLPMIWIAMRHGLRPTMLLALLLNFVLSTWLYLAETPQGQVANMELLMWLSTATGLIIGALIDDRARADQAVEQSELVYRTLFDQSLDPVMVVGGEGRDRGRILMASRAAEAMYGYAVDEIVGMSLRALKAEPCPEGIEERLDRALAGGHVSQVLTHRRRDGSHFPVEVHAGPITIDGRRHLLLIHHDISERLEHEQQRAQLERGIEHARKLESIGLLAGGIAHDYNNLLMAIMGNLELAKLSLTENSGAVEPINESLKAAGQAAELTRQMLAYSGRGRFVVAPLGLGALVIQQQRTLRETLPSRIDLRIEVDGETGSVNADAAQIRQALGNMLANAREAIGEHPGTIVIRAGERVMTEDELNALTFHATLGGGRYGFISVSDSGHGIEAKLLPRILDPFFSTKFTGRGLGLAAVQGIARGHQGALNVANNPGGGAEFTLYLPVSRATHGPGGNGAAAGAKRGSIDDVPPSLCPGLGGTALVADDDQVTLEMTAAMLERCGMKALKALNGLEILNLYQRHRGEVRLIMMDVGMPRLDGVETLRAIRAFDPNMRIILFSGSPEDEAVPYLKGADYQAFLRKPVRPAQLAEVLKGLFEPRQAGLATTDETR